MFTKWNYEKIWGVVLIIFALEWIVGTIIYLIYNTPFLITMLWVSGIASISGVLVLGIILFQMGMKNVR